MRSVIILSLILTFVVPLSFCDETRPSNDEYEFDFSLPPRFRSELIKWFPFLDEKSLKEMEEAIKDGKPVLPAQEAAPIVPAMVVPIKFQLTPIKEFSFVTKGELSEWEEKIFKGKVIYDVETAQDLSYVKATSSDAASALYYKIKLDSKKKSPVVSWKWRVTKFPEKKQGEDLSKKDEDDYAARVYVIFLAKFLLNSHVVEYVWAEKLPVGTTGDSPYSDKIKLMVLESGPAPEGEWKFEERDVVADYIALFGKKPDHDMGAFSFMTNTEHTGSTASAMYDEIRIGYKKSTGEKGGEQK